MLDDCWYWRSAAKDTIECQIERAEHACLELDGYERQWFMRILDLLRNGHDVRIAANGSFIDVTAIAYTYWCASFFDIYNGSKTYLDINYNVFPYPVKKEQYALKYTLI